MSPEMISHALGEYIEVLKAQAGVAEAFFFGKFEEGLVGLLKLPEGVRLKIDELIWKAAGGGALDPTERESQLLIAGSIMRSLEERMGLFSPE